MNERTITHGGRELGTVRLESRDEGGPGSFLCAACRLNVGGYAGIEPASRALIDHHEISHPTPAVTPIEEQLSRIEPHLTAAVEKVAPAHYDAEARAALRKLALVRFTNVGLRDHGDAIFHKTRTELAVDVVEEQADAAIYTAVDLWLQEQEDDVCTA